MKTLYVITYDLKQPGRDYTSLYAAIKEQGDWLHPVDSTWFVHSTRSAASIESALDAKMDSNDKLIVLKVAGPGNSKNLTASEVAWLSSRLPNL